LTPCRISGAELSQYSNEITDDNLEFDDVSQINFSLQIDIDNWFGRRPNLRNYDSKNPIAREDLTILSMGVEMYRNLRPE